MRSNIAVVGCGYWGKNFVRNLHDLKSLYCISEKDHAKAEEFIDTLNVKNYSFKQVINDKNVDAVVLAVPAQHHSKMAIAAMESKKHVFVEKPLAMNVRDATSMIKISEKNNVNLMVGHLLHYHPAFIEVKKLCKNGKIGRIKQIIANRMSLGKIRSEEDVIWSFAPHDISMILSLVNEDIKSIYTSGKKIVQDQLSDLAQIQINFANDISAKISVSWLHPFKEHKLVIIGEAGMLVFDDTNDWDKKLSLIDYSITNSDETISVSKNIKNISLYESEPLREECIHFINLINNKAKNITDGYEGLEVLKVMKAASESLKKEDIIYINND